MSFFGLYFHWPFCLSKCPYCDFNSHVRSSINQKRWQKSLETELEILSEKQRGKPLESIFFGGGTPSLMAPETVASLIEKAKQLFCSSSMLEITLEANPGTVERERFKAFSEAGVNRLSLGIQSLRDDVLNFLGRKHSAQEALKSLEVAASYFPRYSFDLIYARPQQTENSWRDELLEALSYANGHLSLYQLTLEPQTVFSLRAQRGEIMSLEEEPAAHLYEKTEEIMTSAGLPSYEISNYATPGQECRHNLLYWKGKDYLGIGPGAHGRLTEEGIRYATTCYKAPETWLEKVEREGHGLQRKEALSPQETLEEQTLMGLRLTEGLNLSSLFETTGLSVDEAYSLSNLERLIQESLLRRTDSHLIPTLEGRLKLNSVISYLFKKTGEPGSRF